MIIDAHINKSNISEFDLGLRFESYKRYIFTQCKDHRFDYYALCNLVLLFHEQTNNWNVCAVRDFANQLCLEGNGSQPVVIKLEGQKYSISFHDEEELSFVWEMLYISYPFAMKAPLVGATSVEAELLMKSIRLEKEMRLHLPSSFDKVKLMYGENQEFEQKLAEMIKDCSNGSFQSEEMEYKHFFDVMENHIVDGVYDVDKKNKALDVLNDIKGKVSQSIKSRIERLLKKISDDQAKVRVDKVEGDFVEKKYEYPNRLTQRN